MIKQLKTSTKLQVHGSLVWDDDLGYGIDSTLPITYGKDYFNYYKNLDDNDLSDKLTNERIKMVERHTCEKPLDIGIGSGKFCEKMRCYGYDINPLAVGWLKSQKRFIDPYAKRVFCMTLWDSLEHIENPSELIKTCVGFIFCSIPVFKDVHHCLGSKHYKPGEHIWYFTHDGFIAYMANLGFLLQEYNNAETMLGRDGIVSYCFKRK